MTLISYLTLKSAERLQKEITRQVQTQWQRKYIQIKFNTQKKHCQKHSGPKALNTLIQSTPMVGCDDFNFLSWIPLASSQKVPVTETNTWT